jgi:hypothetical protein
MKYSVNQIAEIIEVEGLEYAITNYCSPSSIRDEELATLWEEARDLLIRIQEYVDNHNGSDDYEDEEDGD